MSPSLPKTLREFAGVPSVPASLSRAVLLLIDVQREYVDGSVPIAGIEASMREIRRVLDRARAAQTPVIHVVHHGKIGGALFDPKGPYVAIPDLVAPIEGERIVVKSLLNAFNGTTLQDDLVKIGRQELIVVGYGTHMCVSSTTRAAAELGYRVTVVANATGSRDLPDGFGGVVSAADMHRANLAALGDRFATIVGSSQDLLE